MWRATLGTEYGRHLTSHYEDWALFHRQQVSEDATEAIQPVFLEGNCYGLGVGLSFQNSFGN
jgi:hypothetical protein